MPVFRGSHVSPEVKMTPFMNELTVVAATVSQSQCLIPVWGGVVLVVKACCGRCPVFQGLDNGRW